MGNMVLYTDGACHGNPGPGGWAYVLIADGKKAASRAGGAPETTNNRMELMAVINGLKAMERGSKLTVRSDSQYVINAFTKGWVEKWKANGWSRSGDELANRDLWKTLYLLAQSHTIEWKWIRGHAGEQYNELCDRMATQAAQAYADGELVPIPSDQEIAAESLPQTESEQMSMLPATQEQGSRESACQANQAEMKELKGALADALFVLDMSLIHANIRDYGLEMPCGACPWCDCCTEQMPQEGCFSCAKAYVAYHIAKNKVKVHGLG